MKKVLVALLAVMSVQSFALTFKVAVIAPEGTSWSEELKKTIKKVKKETDGRVKFKVYYGGTQGDEPDVLRKVRVGHLHGGIFTGKTLGEIDGNIRVMEVPFTFFDDNKKARNVLEKMTPYFNDSMHKKGFKNLGFFEVGLIYLISKSEVHSMSDISGMKIWAWEGDEVALSFINYLKMVPVPLASTDVLTSLSTGIIESAYGPLVGILALQWHTSAKSVVNFPVTYSLGSFILDNKRWNKVSASDKQIVEKIFKEGFKNINAANIEEAQLSKDALKSLGIKFTDLPPKDIATASKMRTDIVKELVDKVFSKDALNKLNGYLK